MTLGQVAWFIGVLFALLGVLMLTEHYIDRRWPK